MATSEFDQDIEYIVNELVDTLEGMPPMGPPFASVKLGAEEQSQRYLEMRDKPEDWRKLLQEKPWPEVIDYALSMEHRQGRKEPEHAAL